MGLPNAMPPIYRGTSEYDHFPAEKIDGLIHIGDNLSRDKLREIKSEMFEQDTIVALPKFKMETRKSAANGNSLYNNNNYIVIKGVSKKQFLNLFSGVL